MRGRIGRTFREWLVYNTPIGLLSINGVILAQVESFVFVGTTISNNISQDANKLGNTKKVQQRLFFLRRIRRFGIGH